MQVTRIVGAVASFAAAFGLVVWFSGRQMEDKPEAEVHLVPDASDPASGELQENPFQRPAAAPFPKAEVTETEFDFGVMAFDPDKANYKNNSHGFVVKNVGEAPLLLAKGPSTCQCTMSTLTDLELQPGESTTISLTWEPTLAQDDFSKQATIWTNDPVLWDADKERPGQLLLTVKGKVVPTVEIAPVQFSLGTIDETAPTPLPAFVTSRIRPEFTLSVKSISSPHITVNLVPLTETERITRKVVSGYKVDAQLAPLTSIGRIKETIVLETDDEQLPELIITVEGHRQGPITVAGRTWNPAYSVIDFDTFPASKGAQSILSLYSAKGDEPLQLELVEKSPPELDVTIERDDAFPEEGREHHRVTIRIPKDAAPTRLAGKDAGVIRIRTNLENLPELKFRVIYESN